VTQATRLASRLPGGGAALRAAAGAAYLHGMSIVMLTCGVVTGVTALASLRFLPGTTRPTGTRHSMLADTRPWDS
jgi:hypothetical protein